MLRSGASRRNIAKPAGIRMEYPIAPSPHSFWDAANPIRDPRDPNPDTLPGRWAPVTVDWTPSNARAGASAGGATEGGLTGMRRTPGPDIRGVLLSPGSSPPPRRLWPEKSCGSVLNSSGRLARAPPTPWRGTPPFPARESLLALWHDLRCHRSRRTTVLPPEQGRRVTPRTRTIRRLRAHRGRRPCRDRDFGLLDVRDSNDTS